MEPIIITCGDQTVQFTNSGITVRGTEYLYSGISHLWHVPQRSAYAFICEGQTIAFRYEEKDAPVLQALFARIGQALHLTVEEYHVPETAKQMKAKAAARTEAQAEAVTTAQAEAKAAAQAEAEAVAQPAPAKQQSAPVKQQPAPAKKQSAPAVSPKATHASSAKQGPSAAQVSPVKQDPSAAHGSIAAQDPSAASGPVDEPRSGKATPSGTFRDRLFLVELAAGILLISLGIIGFVLQ